MLKNEFHNTALIDGDYIIWIACNPNKVYEHGIPRRENNKFVYTDKTLDEAKATCDLYMNDILNLTKADSYILCMSIGTNFRVKMDQTYKANRIGMPKPLWFDEIKAYMFEKWGAIGQEGLEADDIVNIIKNQLEKSFIIASDKDILECIPGRHFDARRGKVEFLEVDKKTAELNFAISILTGDDVDGIPHLTKGMGPKTAEGAIMMRMDMNLISPISAAFNIYLQTLGQTEGIKRFANQYRLLKMLDTVEEARELGMDFTIPTPLCFNCIETVLSTEEYEIKYLG